MSKPPRKEGNLRDRLAKQRQTIEDAGREVKETFALQRGDQLALKYDPAYCEHLVERGRAGWSLREVAVELGVVTQTFDNWEKKYSEFAEAKAMWREARIAYYERCHRENADGRMKGSAGLISMFLGKHASDDYSDPNKNTIGIDDPTKDGLSKVVAALAASPFSLIAANPPTDEQEKD